MYRGEKYLDDRLNGITEIDDLKNWSIPIPNGFEVFFNDHWYTYNSENTFDDTLGYFRIRSEIVQDFGDGEEVGISQKKLTEKFSGVDSSINKLMVKVYPLTMTEFSISPKPGNFEVGTEISGITASWFINYSSEDYKLKPTSNTFFIDDIPYSGENTITVDNNNKITWNSRSESFKKDNPGTITFKFTSTYKDENLGGLSSSISSPVQNYSFLYRRFWLVSNKSSLESKDITTSTSSDLSNSYTKSVTTFNCSGGKYPYFVLPTEIVNSGRAPQFWVGGLENTDITSGTLNLERNKLTIGYTWYRLSNIQTSSNVKIEFK